MKACSSSWWPSKPLAHVLSYSSKAVQSEVHRTASAFSLSLMRADLSSVISTCSLQFLLWLSHERKEKLLAWTKSRRLKTGRSFIHKVLVFSGSAAVGSWGNRGKLILLFLYPSEVREEKITAGKEHQRGAEVGTGSVFSSLAFDHLMPGQTLPRFKSTGVSRKDFHILCLKPAALRFHSMNCRKQWMAGQGRVLWKTTFPTDMELPICILHLADLKCETTEFFLEKV